MKKHFWMSTVVVALMLSGFAVSAVADPAAKPATAGVDQTAALALAKKSGCLACHAVDRKVVGPAWKDVAAKYKGQAGVEAKLIEKVKKGGAGVWGQTPMPANSPRVSDANIKTLVEFVLSLN
jgi:cytochrome c